MGCMQYQKIKIHRQEDDMCVIQFQSCQAVPIIINQTQVKTDTFGKQYQLFPEQIENTNQPLVDIKRQNSIPLSNIEINNYPDSPENSQFELILMINDTENKNAHNGGYIKFNQIPKTRTRSNKSKRRKVNMEILESQF